MRFPLGLLALLSVAVMLTGCGAEGAELGALSVPKRSLAVQCWTPTVTPSGERKSAPS